MPVVFLGVGAALLALMAFAGASKAPKRKRRAAPTARATTPTPEATEQEPDAQDATDAYARAGRGEATAEDYEVLAEASEIEGDSDAAAQFAALAAEAPEAATLADVDDDTPRDDSPGRTPAWDQPEATPPAPAPVEAAPTPEPIPIVPQVPIEVVAPTPVPVIENGAPEVPAGFNPEEAQDGARDMSKYIAARGFNYSRPRLRAWQLLAGIAPDGLYGGGTRGALLYYGVTSPPSPLFAPRTTSPYPAHLRA